MAGKMIKLDNKTKNRPLLKNIRDNNEDLTVKRFLEFYDVFLHEKQLAGLSFRTIEDYKIHMKYFLEFIKEYRRSIIDRPQDTYVDFVIFQDYLNYMTFTKQFKPCTVNVRLRTLKCYLTWLYSNDHIDENYSLRLKLQKVPIDTIQPLEDKEIKRMLKQCDTTTYTGLRNLGLMLLILDNGIRVGEAVDLKIDDIDFNKQLITITGENAKTRQFRQVPFSYQVGSILEELVKISKSNNCEYVFQSTYGGRADEKTIIANFAAIGKKAGVKKRCTPHVFRHTMAVNAIRSNIIDVMTLQKILGHATLITTRKYIQLQTDDILQKHQEADILNKYLKSDSKGRKGGK